MAACHRRQRFRRTVQIPQLPARPLRDTQLGCSCSGRQDGGAEHRGCVDERGQVGFPLQRGAHPDCCRDVSGPMKDLSAAGASWMEKGAWQVLPRYCSLARVDHPGVLSRAPSGARELGQEISTACRAGTTPWARRAGAPDCLGSFPAGLRTGVRKTDSRGNSPSTSNLAKTLPRSARFSQCWRCRQRRALVGCSRPVMRVLSMAAHVVVLVRTNGRYL